MIRAAEPPVPANIGHFKHVSRQGHARGVITVVANQPGEAHGLDGPELGAGELTSVRVEEAVAVAESLELLPDQAVHGGADDGADNGDLEVAGDVEVDILGTAVGLEELVDEVGRDEVGQVHPGGRGAETAVLPTEEKYIEIS